MNNVSLLKLVSFSWSQLAPRTKIKLALLSLAKIFVNLLDLAGIAAIGILTLHFIPNGGSSKQSSLFGLNLPNLNQEHALGLASLILLMFVLKSVLSIGLTSKFLSLLAREETNFVGNVLGGLPGYLASSGKKEPINTVQMSLSQGSRSLFSGLLGTSLVFISEGSLFLMIAGALAIANTLAAVLMFVYFGLVSFFLVRLVSTNVLKFAITAEKSTQDFYSGVSDFAGSSQEITLAGNSPIWVQALLEKRIAASKANNKLQTHYSLPRYVIETSLIAGIFLLLGYFVLFSDLVTAAPTIGIFLAGSLRLTSALMPLQNALNVFKSHQASARFAFRLFSASHANSADERRFVFSPVSLVRGDEVIRFQNVSFVLPTKFERVILQDLSFEILKGEKFAIVGPSGAGKTTLIKLLLGSTSPSSGKIEVVVDPGKARGSSTSNILSVVPQKPNAISGGIEANVTLTPEGSLISKEDLSELLDRVQLNDLGSDPEVDLKALSGGEVQRLSLARALWSKSQIIVMDEPTSSLDANAESAISKVLNELKGEVTQVVVAHRLSTIQDADRILYLDNGRILAIEKFEQLRKIVPAFDQAVRQMSF